MRSIDRPIYVFLSVMLGAFALISVNSAPAIGRHDGAGAYVIVMATAAVCVLVAMVAFLLAITSRPDHSLDQQDL